MTIDEVSRNFQIPIKILKKYESWGGCGAVNKVIGDWQYDDQDLEKLSLIITLQEIGLDEKEVREYMMFLNRGEDTENERLRILQKKRVGLLDEIHFLEKKLEHLDYMRYEITKKNKRI